MQAGWISVRAAGYSMTCYSLQPGHLSMSGAPSISGTSQFPKPPIIIGITIKKIMTKAWAVTTTL